MLIPLLKTYLAPYKRAIAGLVALQFVATGASLYLPSLFADIIDNGVTQGNTDYIVRTGGWMLLVSLVQIVCSVAAVMLGARSAMSAGRDLRRDILHRVGTFSAREVGRFGAPSLITRNTNDVQQVQLLIVMGFTIVVMAPIMCVGGIVMALREDLGLSWILLIAVPGLALSMGLIVARMVPGFRAMQVRIDAVNRVLREQISVQSISDGDTPCESQAVADCTAMTSDAAASASPYTIGRLARIEQQLYAFELSLRRSLQKWRFLRRHLQPRAHRRKP